MTVEELRVKYGDRKIGVVEASVFDGMRTWTPIEGEDKRLIDMELKYLPRCEMELDESYRQPIAYVLITDMYGRYFTTRRKAGDARLTGKISLGIGGHIESGETFWNSVMREINEEVDLGDVVSKYKMFTKNLGYIVSSNTPVDRVHAGVIMRMIVDSGISVKETDALEGKWMTISELKHADLCGELESWASILLNNNVLTIPLDFNEIASALMYQYVRKNTDYGCAAHKSIERFGYISGFIRINDKIERIKSLEKSGKSLVDEKIIDTFGDAVTYTLMFAAEFMNNSRDTVYDDAPERTIDLFETFRCACINTEPSYESPDEMMSDLLEVYETVKAHEDLREVLDKTHPFIRLSYIAGKLIFTMIERSTKESIA